MFETENYEYTDIKEINKINDFGRRIYMPFSEDDNRTCFQCAEKSYIACNGKDIFNTFEKEQNLHNPEAFNTSRIASFIKKLLTNDESGYSITTDEKIKNTTTQ